MNCVHDSEEELPASESLKHNVSWVMLMKQFDDTITSTFQPLPFWSYQPIMAIGTDSLCKQEIG